MALSSFTKQPYESFPVAAAFTNDMASGETIVSQDITCVDSASTDTTSTMLTDPTNDGEHTAEARILGGTESMSPYKITFKIVTSTDNKWEHEFLCKIKEL